MARNSADFSILTGIYLFARPVRNRQERKPSSQSEAGWDATPGDRGSGPPESPASPAAAQAEPSSPAFATRPPPARHAASSART
ncbi:hypothetical protein VTH06DRAFT_3326 [Thermothelomyces fergusii]